MYPGRHTCHRGSPLALATPPPDAEGPGRLITPQTKQVLVHRFEHIANKVYREYPIATYFPITVVSEHCQYREITNRWTGEVIVADFLHGDPVSCEDDLVRMQEVVSCLKKEMRHMGGYGKERNLPFSDREATEIDEVTRE